MRQSCFYFYGTRCHYKYCSRIRHKTFFTIVFNTGSVRKSIHTVLKRHQRAHNRWKCSVICSTIRYNVTYTDIGLFKRTTPHVIILFCIFPFLTSFSPFLIITKYYACALSHKHTRTHIHHTFVLKPTDCMRHRGNDINSLMVLVCVTAKFKFTIIATPTEAFVVIL